MLSTHKQKKKNQRQKAVREKLIQRRQRLLVKKKKEKNIQQLMRASEPKQQPFRKPLTPEEEAARQIEIKKKLEHNLEILKALDEEYDREMKAKEALNNKLEAQGNITPEQKIQALAENL